MDKTDLVAIRDYTPEDRNFVFATFLRGIYYGDFFYGEVKKATFMAKYHQILENLLPLSKIRVACDKSDPSVIYSFVMTNKAETIIHFAFTKAAWRNIGLAKSLTPVTVESASHLTKQGLSLIRKYNIQFDPFSIT